MKEKIVARINVLFKMANEKFFLNIENVDVDFSLKGLAAGQVVVDGNKITLRVNNEALISHYEFMCSEMLPHEVAHIVQYLLEGHLSHDSRWRHYCELLGGTPSTTHSLELKPARKQRQWLYKVEEEICILSTIRHNRIQRQGTEYITNSGRTIRRDHFIKELT